MRETITVSHFSGRNRTLSRLDEFLKEPKARCFLLVGLPGVGKTALASSWVASLKGRVHVFWRCLRPESSARDILHDLADMLYSVGRPALSDYLRRPSEDGRDHSMSILKRDLSGIPLLLVLDNAHLARTDVATIVTELMGLESVKTNPKVLLLARERVSFCTAEDRALGRLLEQELADLERPEAYEMMAALAVDESRRDAVWERCGGHPLSLEMATIGAMPMEEVRRISTARLVQDVLSRLDPAIRETLAFAAMFEGGAPLDVLGGHSSELLRFCLLREEDGGKVSVHDLVREAAIHGLEPGKLAELHARAGNYLARSKSPVDILAAVRHFIDGGAMRQAEELVVERGQEVLDSGMAENLVALTDQLAWASRESKSAQRLLLLRGNAYFALGRWSEAAREYEKCSAVGSPFTVAEALLGLGKTEVQRHSPLALQHLKAAEERLEGLGALRLLAEAQYWIGGFHEDSGHLDEARDAFEKGRIIAFSTGDRRWEGLCRYGIGRVRSSLDDLAGEVEEEREAIRLLEREGYRLEVAKVCAALGGALNAQGQTEEAESFIIRAITEARATGAINVLASSLYNLASLRHDAGRMKEAIPLLEEALVLHEQLEKHDEAAWCAAWIASEEWLGGRPERGDSYASRANRLLSRTTEPALRAQALRNLARAALRAGRTDDAGRYLRQAIDEARTAGLERLSADLSGELGKIG